MNSIEINAKTTALLSVDLQLYDIEPSMGLLRQQSPEVVSSFLSHMQDMIIPNAAQLQSTFRKHQLETLHTRIMSMTNDGRDRSRWHKQLGLHIAPNDPLGAFIDEVAPTADEMVFNKTASGVFNSTNLNYVLRNLGIETIIVCGVYTDECISNAIRAGCDLGYQMVLVTDACAAVSEERHQRALDELDNRYCYALTTEDTLKRISQSL